MSTATSTSDVLPLLNAKAATGTGTSKFWVDSFGHIQSFVNWTVQVITTGAPASVSVQLQGSLDNATWVSVGSAVAAAGVTAVSAGANIAFPYVRANLATLTGGTAPTVTVLAVGVN